MKHFYQHIFRILLFAVLCLFLIREAYADLPYDISCTNKISAPTYSYEGHYFTVKNSSVFNLEGSYFNTISEAISKGYAVCEWVESANSKKDIKTQDGCIVEQKLRYDDPTTANIKLIQTWVKSSIYGIQNESEVDLTIRACPYLDSAIFTGEQRAYQRQELSLRIAQHPDYPIDLNSITLQIFDASGAEVEFHRDVSIAVDSDNYFVDVSIEFLTKNASSENFSYRVTCKDSRSQSLDITEFFYVLKDQAPKASIDMKLKFYRSQGGGPATITASSNGKFTDDETILTWDVPGGSYTDESGGAASSISFTLATPGKYQITLHAKDNWQDTLDEFVSDDERKTAYITVTFKVDNIAPVLGIGTSEKTLELLLINSGLDDGELISTLLESGVNAEIYHKEIDQDEQPEQFTLEATLTGVQSNPYDQYTYFQSASSIDSKYIFRFMPGTLTTSLASGPYSVYRYDLSDLAADPTIFTIQESSLPAASTKLSMHLGRDLQEKFLYICMGGNTVILDKESGYVYPTVNMMLGTENIALGSYVYSLTDTGIYKVSLDDGSFELFSDLILVSGSDTNARIYKGNACFVVQDGDEIKLAKFDLKKETISLTTLFTAASKNYLVAITPRGRLVVNAQEGAVSTVYTFENTGAYQHDPLTIDICSLYSNSVYSVKNAIGAVYDCSGEVNFVYTAIDTQNGGRAKIWLYKLDGSYSATKTSSAITYFTHLLSGWQYSDGTVIVVTGCNYSSTATGTSSYKCMFKTKDESASSSPVISNKMEWSIRCNDTVVLGSCCKKEAKLYVYKFTEGYEFKCDRTALETLNFKSQYQERSSSTDFNAVVASCLNKCKVGSSSSPNPSARHYDVGETVDIADFNIIATDYENDTINPGANSLGLPRAFTQPGKYTFTYYVTDDTGNPAFNYKSSTIKLTFYVDGDTPTEEDSEEKPEDESSGRKIYILHRKY